ncbi:MAG: AraC family transcriptional regulator [Burkholderiales bacterium]|nr:AraC family transcriptional regulator [Burkholderiales bacterium]
MPARIRSASLSGYLDLARDCGLDGTQMLREFGINPRALADPEALIDVLAVRRLLEATSHRAGREDFGLRLAASRRLSNLGPISLVLRDSTTGREALETLLRHMRLLNTSLLTRIEDAGDVVIIREEFLLGEPGTLRQSLELAIGVMHRILQELLGQRWQARQVAFIHRAPLDPSTHYEVFGRRVAFNAEFNGIVCARGDLERPLERADPAMARIARKYVERSLESDRAGPAERVRDLILALMPTGRCTVERVAGHLGVDRRTVHRQLSREGTTFRILLERARAELAERHARDGNRSLAEIGGMLGFADASAFSRWFRTAFGASVTRWRRAGHPSPGALHPSPALNPARPTQPRDRPARTPRARSAASNTGRRKK